ncbi:hypothetical protein ACVMFA_004502 [Bradyrhizobium liaoningense]
MSTVTLSKPHCAIISAEKPEGMASHALTTALPDFQISLTLFATLPSFFVDLTHCRCKPPGPREARPDDGLREAVQNFSAMTLWIAPSLARLAMTKRV